MLRIVDVPDDYFERAKNLVKEFGDSVTQITLAIANSVPISEKVSENKITNNKGENE